jgi:hypothetical protein
MTTRHIFSALPLVVAAVALAGCGGNGGNPSVADVGTGATGTNTTTTSSSGDTPRSGGGSLSSGKGGGGPSMVMKMTNGAKFASCMRSHGVPNFPDPGSDGSISIGPSSGINPDSPKFKEAQTACQKLLPHGGQASPAQQAKAQKAALDFSKCMRAHGVPNFPDPQFSGGHVSLGIKSGQGGLDPNSPTFRAAQQACQGHLPFGKGPTSSSK